MKSIESKRLLPWQNFRLVSQSTAQKELAFTGESLNKTILSNDWVRKATAVNPEFIKRYYENSRLHHLSVWKDELKEIVAKLQVNNLPKKRKIMEDGPRVFM